MLARDILIVNMTLLTEMLGESSDTQECYDMTIDVAMMTVHAAGSACMDRVTGITRWFGGVVKSLAHRTS